MAMVLISCQVCHPSGLEWRKESCVCLFVASASLHFPNYPSCVIIPPCIK
ncbi:unnamed protein product [Amoebophrya sp. A120]|nr:unnamed protein product [Amoebophrya sp. A120]|eukprot:GSA120T00000548001.1